jgi:hypothetical protein
MKEAYRTAAKQDERLARAARLGGERERDQMPGPGSPFGGIVQQLPSGVFFGSSVVVVVVVVGVAVVVVWLSVSLMMFSSLICGRYFWVPGASRFIPAD